VKAAALLWRLYYAAKNCLDWRWIVWGYQRLTRGFSDRQLWDLSTRMALYILPRLKEFRRQMDGPKGDFFGTPLKFFPNLEPTTEESERAAAEWRNALDEMIYAFECIADEDFESPVTMDDEWGWTVEPAGKGSDPTSRRLMTYGIHVDEEAATERNRRIRQGLGQFANHFESIWW